MQVTFLGTGSAMPIPGRVQTGILLEREDRRLLIDCGSGVLNRLSETDAGYEGVSTVLLTHHHLDHVADLLPLTKARWLAGEQSLEVVGPPGTEALIDGLLDVHEYMQDRIDLAVREISVGSSRTGTDVELSQTGTDAESFRIGGFAVDAIETRHSMRCHAYRFSGEGGAFAFSGDSEAFDGLASFAAGSAVLAHDCSFPDGVETENHPTPGRLGEVLAGSEIDRVYLTHLYPHTEGKHREMIESVNRSFDGDVEMAEDGLRIEV